VENLGFRVIAIESGITEGRVVHDHVTGTPGDLGTVMQQGISMGFDRFPQNEELVKWMREWNADPRHQQKLEFFGFDVPGSSGNPFGRRDAARLWRKHSTTLVASMPNEQMFRGVWRACGHVFKWCRTPPIPNCRSRTGPSHGCYR
jgi:erythromycin esterase-like protein